MTVFWISRSVYDIISRLFFCLIDRKEERRLTFLRLWNSANENYVIRELFRQNWFNSRVIIRYTTDVILIRFLERIRNEYFRTLYILTFVWVLLYSERTFYTWLIFLCVIYVLNDIRILAYCKGVSMVICLYFFLWLVFYFHFIWEKKRTVLIDERDRPPSVFNVIENHYLPLSVSKVIDHSVSPPSFIILLFRAYILSHCSTIQIFQHRQA